jgi:hypothetical protein
MATGYGSAQAARERHHQPAQDPPVLRLADPNVLHGWQGAGGFSYEALRDGSVRLAGPGGLANVIPQGSPSIPQILQEAMSIHPLDVTIRQLSQSLGVMPPPAPQPQVQAPVDPSTGQSLQHFTGPAPTNSNPHTVTLPSESTRQGPQAGTGAQWPTVASAQTALTNASSEAQGLAPSTKLILAVVLAAVAAAAAAAAATAAYSYARKGKGVA